MLMYLNKKKKGGNKNQARRVNFFLKGLISPGSAQEPGLIAHVWRQIKLAQNCRAIALVGGNNWD